MDRKSQEQNGKGIAILSLVFICTALFLYDIVKFNNGINVVNIQEDLKSNVFKQQTAIDIIVQALDDVNNLSYNQLTVISFVGSSGTGKTFTAKILKNHFPVSLDLLQPIKDEDKQQEVLDKLSNELGVYNLIVIDDLNMTDAETVLNFIQKLPNNFNIILLCIFSNQKTDFNLRHSIDANAIDLIKSKFYNAGIVATFAEYEAFDEYQVNDWVKLQLSYKGINPKSITHILEEVLKDFDVKFKGLKGLHSRIQTEL